ncbi:MAG: DEAD/DEAH box helicase, partial [Thaumarchaeota archaeon]|nr:DEAD/DEAH box helicase [Nitrososphaerota archaeon]
TLPASSGKTMIAEFKILQVQSQRGKDFWIAYVVPTRALVNQITSGLRRDFDGLGIRVEKMSGALEQNKFEESLVNSREFDVLVTTPEKLNLLLRQDSQAGQKSKLCNSLALTVIDEAHNIGNPKRGLALEMLISIIKNDCMHASLLLLTPRMPDAKDVAKWLDPENPKDISMQLDWVPNDSVVGAFYPKGVKRDITTQFKPILYSGSDFEMNEICLGSESHSMDTFSNIRDTKYMRTVYAAYHMVGRGNVLVVANDVKTSWNIAKKLSELMNSSEQDDDIDLVKKFVKAELGETFELVKYLDYRIGVHNAGLPDDILKLLEWLMENGKLKILVSTTTIAQGVNFPASTILLPTYYLKNQSDIKAGSKKMTAIDFMNIAGRVGRTHQSIGIVGISTDGTNVDLEKLKNFLKKDVEKIFSALYKLCDTVMKQNRQFDLSAFANEPGWSNFIQYLAHMYNQSSNLDDFIMRAEIILRNTYGYIQMNKQTQIQLLKAVKEYGSELDNNPKVSLMSDNTGFSPNTVESAAQKIKSENIVLDKSLFSGSSETLTKLIHIMRNDIPELDWTDTSHKNRFSDDDLNKIMTAWVAGDKIYEISEKYFGGTDTDSVRGCITTIYKKIVNYATWGLSAVEKISE